MMSHCELKFDFCNILFKMFQLRMRSVSLLCLSSFLRLGQILYRKVPKFSDARKLWCNLPKIQEKRPNLRVFRQKDANGIANSENPDQTAPRGAV